MQHNLADKAAETLREELADYLAGKQSLRHFYNWFAPETTDIHLWAPKPLQDMVYTIKLLLAEYSRGHRTEAYLQERLRPFVNPTIELEPVAKRDSMLVQRIKQESHTSSKVVRSASPKRQRRNRTIWDTIGRAAFSLSCSACALLQVIEVASAGSTESAEACA